jgi:tripartite-type tricarboxylate transporter receptor subunit TctC
MRAKMIFLLISTVVCLCITPGDGTPAAERYPGRDIQLVTTQPPGGLVDIAVRMIHDSLSNNLGVPIVVNNRPGAGGVTGTHYLVKSKPDGYTFGSLSSKDAVLVPATIPEVPFKYSDLEPLCKFINSPTVVFCKADTPWKSLEDLIADAKKRPGKITYAATTHSVSHFLMEGLQKTAGISMMHIPLQAVGQTITRVLGGNLDIGVSAVAPVAGQLKAGALRALFVVSPQRMANLPQVPTLKEKGFRESVLTLYTGFFAPRGVPRNVRETLEKALEKTLKAPGLNNKLEAAGEMSLEYLPAKAFTKEIEEDYKQVMELSKAMQHPHPDKRDK